MDIVCFSVTIKAMMKFSRRTDWPNVPNPISQSIDEKKRNGVSLIDLTESNPTHCGFNFLNEKLLKPLRNPKNLIYSPDSSGLREAREVICAYYAEKNISVSPEQLILTASTSEAYSFLLRLLCDPGDHVAIPRPSYPLFEYLTALTDVDTDGYPLTYELNTWRIVKDKLEAVLLQNPKALILVNPNNPTGNLVKSEELLLLNKLCRRSDTAIISDEVFLDFTLEAKHPVPISLAGNEEVLTFTVSGISKILALPQMKLSWIIVSGPKDFKERALERLAIIADTFLSVNTPVQQALGSWFRSRKVIQQEILKRVKANRGYLVKKFENNKKVSVFTGEGGWYAVLRFQSDKNDEEVSLGLLERHQVIIHPGYFFDFEGENFLVLSLLLPSETFEKGIETLESELSRVSMEPS